MLEFLANVDPMSLPLWAVLAFAAGMYPVGLMLGAPCSPCCGCAACETGSLPSTITVTLHDFPHALPYQGPDLIYLGFDSCFGSGAAARVTAPGGDPAVDKGPIASVSITNSGSGYAKLGRVEPSVTASGGSGTGATLAVTLAEDADGCGIPFWKVDSVSVADGTGYADGDPVTFTIAEGDTEASAASATIHTTRNEPTLSASAPLGSGAAFTLSYTKNAGTPETWTISSVSVTSGGTGYHGGDSLTISLDTDDVEQAAAYAQIVTSRSEPTLSASVSSETGSGATLSVSLSATYDPGGDAWAVSSLGIEDGGSGYAVDDAISISVDDGEQAPYEAAYAYVSSVDENGAITGIEIGYGGVYYKDEGIITSVALYYGGAYYKDDGVPVSVSVDGGGVYYREDSAETPYVADVTVSIYQSSPSTGAGAIITATVGDDPGDPATFGTITGLTIEDGGDGYLAWETLYKTVCCDWFNGKDFVLRRGAGGYEDDLHKSTTRCEYIHQFCGVGNLFGHPAELRVVYEGPSVYPKVYLVSETFPSSDSFYFSHVCNTTLTSGSLVTDCDDFSFTATGEFGGESVSATVTPGGDYETASTASSACFICCKGADAVPEEIEIQFDGDPAAGQDFRSGNYVLPRFVQIGGSGYPDVIRWATVFPDFDYTFGPAGIVVGIEACSTQRREDFTTLTGDTQGRTLWGVLSRGTIRVDGVWNTRITDASDCLECDKCMTWVRPGGYFLDAGVLPFAGPDPGLGGVYASSIDFKSCADACEPNPVCAPKPGEYPIVAFGTVTIL